MSFFPLPRKIHNQNQTVVIDVSAFNNSDNMQHQHQQQQQQEYVHQTLMNIAIEEAKQAGLKGEVPIGAIIVKEEKEERYDTSATTSNNKYRTFTILSTGQNQIETIHDASAHAELQALRSASYNIQNWRLLNTTLYTTLEPCPMCLSASQAFRVERIVYGAPDLRLGAVETHMRLLDVAKHPFHDEIEVIGGVYGEECGKLLIHFFRERRKQRKAKKKKNLIDNQPQQQQQITTSNEEHEHEYAHALPKRGKRYIFFNWFSRFRKNTA
jgi:tRNA(adenine34) deaminase